MTSKSINDQIETIHHFRGQVVQGYVVWGEALRYLQSLAPACASLVFLDPPFNLGKKYSDRPPRMDRIHTSLYQYWMNEVLLQAVRVLKPGGTLYLYHIPRWAVKFAALLDPILDFKHWIAISMKNGFVRGDRLYPAHYALLMFTKGKPKNFRRPKLRPQRCRSCGEYVKDYGGYQGIIEEKGINLSDIWDDVSPVRHQKHKNRAANELPLTVFTRIFEISAGAGELYVDPFAGSGNGVVEAVKHQMRISCCDILKNNCTLIHERLLKLTGKSDVRDIAQDMSSPETTIHQKSIESPVS